MVQEQQQEQGQDGQDGQECIPRPHSTTTHSTEEWRLDEAPFTCLMIINADCPLQLEMKTKNGANYSSSFPPDAQGYAILFQGSLIPYRITGGGQWLVTMTLSLQPADGWGTGSELFFDDLEGLPHCVRECSHEERDRDVERESKSPTDPPFAFSYSSCLQMRKEGVRQEYDSRDTRVSSSSYGMHVSSSSYDTRVRQDYDVTYDSCLFPLELGED